MASAERTSIWAVSEPASWPKIPGEMTVTTLAAIETCPRRWALGAAEYPYIWSELGYPPRPQMRALAGTVVHLALEKITKELVRAACPSVQDSKAPQVMKALGGFTKVTHDCIDCVLDRLNNNPRAKSLMENASRGLRAQVSELRTRVQMILCRVRLPPRTKTRGEIGITSHRGPLRSGAYPELGIHARRIGWKGRADLLVLSDEVCEISEFKTGAEEDAHVFQVKVYALLWYADEELNPSRRRADRLVLRYGAHDLDVPTPTANELDDIESEITARRDAAHRAVSTQPPEARPTADNCRFCAVRQLCSTYWEFATQKALAAENFGQKLYDVELLVMGRHGPLSWDAVIGVMGGANRGRAAVLRTKDDLEFRSGDRLRVLDASVAIDDEDDGYPAVITLGALSEVYFES